MNLVVWLFAATLAATHSATIDIEKTVQRVQNILQQNDQLPRLSREEILQLLDDIRAEDAKKSAKSRELPDEPTEFDLGDDKEYYSTGTNDDDKYNEINHLNRQPNEDEESEFVDDNAVSASQPTESPEDKVTKNEPTMMVVFPFTPRDGKSLQELYTKQPRVEVVPVPTTPAPKTRNKSKDNIQETLKNNAQVAKNSQKLDYSEELQEFLKSHGFEGQPGQDSFLLPLEGFKPLPPPKLVDGTVQLPENILLTYDLIAPEEISKLDSSKNSDDNKSYQPLSPEYSFELDASSSEDQKTVLPLDLPKSRRPKSAKSTEAPLLQNFEPIDYDSIKVIPLSPGPNPIDQGEKVELSNELDKRQANISLDFVFNSTADPDVLTTPSPDASEAPSTEASTASSGDTKAEDTDSGPSLSDLEDSFGGAAPSEPGDSELPPPKKNGFYWMLDWNSFLEVGDGDTKVNIRLEPKLGDPQMFLPVNVP